MAEPQQIEVSTQEIPESPRQTEPQEEEVCLSVRKRLQKRQQDQQQENERNRQEQVVVTLAQTHGEAPTIHPLFQCSLQRHAEHTESMVYELRGLTEVMIDGVKKHCEEMVAQLAQRIAQLEERVEGMAKRRVVSKA